MDIPKVMASLDISVVTSNSESLSNAILESMAAGKPVIATRVGGNAELVHDGKTGLLIPPQDVPALVQSLQTLLRSTTLRREMGQNGGILARRNFSLAMIRRQHEELYTALLEEKGAARALPHSPRQTESFSSES